MLAAIATLWTMCRNSDDHRGTFEPYVVVILERKKAPNRLVVDESVNDENSMRSLNP